MKCHICLGVEVKSGRVCKTCLNAIREDLSTIERARRATRHGPVATTGGRTGTDRPVPGGVEWLNWQHGGELRDLLASWARVWSEDSPVDLSWPVVTIEALVVWLREHLETVGRGHEAIGIFAEEVHGWAIRASVMMGDTPTGQVVPCPGDGEKPCGRRLRVDIHQRGKDSKGPEQVVRCRACGMEWTAGRLMLRAVSGDTDAWLDPGAIEHNFGVPERTLRRWAAKGIVARKGGRYLLQDVLDAKTPRGA